MLLRHYLHAAINHAVQLTVDSGCALISRYPLADSRHKLTRHKLTRSRGVILREILPVARMFINIEVITRADVACKECIKSDDVYRQILHFILVA